MAPHKKFPALGRGLDALIQTDNVQTEGSSSMNEIAVAQIHPNPNQPRHEFDPEALQELADSIREIGIIQPITLRQMEDGTYEIIAGERRWRASQMAGLETIPAYMDECEALLTESAKLNFKLWNPADDRSLNGGQIINGDENLTFHEAVERLKYNYKKHLQVIRAQL